MIQPNSVLNSETAKLKNHKIPLKPKLDAELHLHCGLQFNILMRYPCVGRLSSKGRIQFITKSPRCRWLYKGYWFSCIQWHLRCSRIHSLSPISYTGRVTLACLMLYMWPLHMGVSAGVCTFSGMWGKLCPMYVRPQRFRNWFSDP